MVKATNKITGESIELETDNYEQVIQAWQVVQEYQKLAERLRDQLKKLVPKFIDDTTNTSEPQNGFMFRRSNVQRYNYDKAVLRKVFDSDTLDLFLEPNKPAVDKYLKVLERLGVKDLHHSGMRTYTCEAWEKRADDFFRAHGIQKGDRLVGLSVGSSTAEKNWPAKNYGKVADHFERR